MYDNNLSCLDLKFMLVLDRPTLTGWRGKGKGCLLMGPTFSITRA